MEYFRHGPYLDVEFEDDPPSGAKHVKAELLNGVEDMLSFTSSELNGRLSDEELSATYATNEYVQTTAFGTNLEATDATVATWVGNLDTITGAKLNTAFAPKVSAFDLNTLYAAADGDPSSSGRSSTSPTTIQSALDYLHQRGTLVGTWKVILAAGIYNVSSVTISDVVSTERIQLLGPDVAGGSPVAILDGQSSPEHAFGIVASGAKLYVKDVKFANYSPGSATGTALQAQNGADLWADNVHVDNCSFIGIYAKGLCELRVTGGTISNCLKGIRSYGNATYVVGYDSVNRRVKINNCHVGVEVRDLSTGHVDYTDIDGCSVGIWGYHGTRLAPKACTISNSTEAAIHVSAGAWWYDNPDYPTVFTNNARNISTGAASSETRYSQFPSEVIADSRYTPTVFTGALSGKVMDLSAVPVEWMREPGNQIIFKVHGLFTGPGNKKVILRMNLGSIGQFASSTNSLKHFTITARMIALTDTTQTVLYESYEDLGGAMNVFQYDTAVNFAASTDRVTDVFAELTDSTGGVTINHVQYSYLPASHKWFDG